MHPLRTLEVEWVGATFGRQAPTAAFGSTQGKWGTGSVSSAGRRAGSASSTE